MAFSKTAIAKAEAEALSQFGVECRYHPSVSTWYKVIGGTVTPFDLRDQADRAMRDWCRKALLQVDYDEQVAKKSGASSGAGSGGFWDTLLGDDDVRSAVHSVMPKPLKPFVNPFMDAMNGVLGSGSGMSATTAAVAKSGIAGAGGFMLGQASGNSGMGGALGGAIGMALGGPVGAAIGAALMSGLETVLVGAIKRAVSNVARSRELGAESADNFSRGALSLSQNALDAGQQIGHALLSGILRPFGVSGNALGEFSAQLGPSLSRLLMGGLGIGAQGLRIAGGAAGVGLGLGGAALGGAAGFALGGGGLGMLMHNPGMLLTGAMNAILPALVGSLIGLIAVKVLSVITGVLGGVLDKLGQAFGEMGRIAGGALKGIIDVLGDVKNAALDLSRSILDLSQQSGLSVSTSSTAVNNLMGLGIAPQKTSQIFGQNVMFQSAMDASMGFKGAPGSAQYLLSVQNQYQQWLKQGNGNPLLANHMMQASGKQDLIPMANLPRRELLQSLEYSRGLEMPSGSVEMWQQRLGLMENRLNQFASFVKITLANAFAPVFERGLGMATEYFKSHQREIVQGIQAIGRWFYADLPNYVLTGAIAVVGGFGSITKALANLIRGFSDGKGALFEFITGVLGGIDRLVAGFLRMGQVAAAAFAYQNTPGGPLLKAAAATVAYRVAGNHLQEYQTHFADDFKRATARQYDPQGRPVPTIMDKATQTLDTASKWSDETGINLKNLQQTTFNRERLGRKYDEFTSTMQMPENQRQSIVSRMVEPSPYEVSPAYMIQGSPSSLSRSFVEKQEVNSSQWSTHERTCEEQSEERTSSKNSLARAVERYSNYQRDIINGQSPSLGEKEGPNGVFGILDLLRAIVENTGRENQVKVDVNVGVSPQEDFLAKVLSYEAYQTWTALGNNV